MFVTPNARADTGAAGHSATRIACSPHIEDFLVAGAIVGSPREFGKSAVGVKNGILGNVSFLADSVAKVFLRH
jgi:hypothetical protein